MFGLAAFDCIPLYVNEVVLHPFEVFPYVLPIIVRFWSKFCEFRGRVSFEFDCRAISGETNALPFVTSP